MIGYVVVNKSNSVVFLDGDDLFKNNLHKLLFKQIRFPSMDNASTSSGIGTDSTEDFESLQARRKKSGFVFDSTEVSHILLPLILLYRSMSDGKLDAFHCISSPLGEISAKKIYDDYLILSFANNAKQRNQLLDGVESTMCTTFGPLISFCNSDLTTVKIPKEMVCAVMKNLNSFKTKNYINIKRMLYYSDKISKLKELLQKTSSQLSVFIGNNRCLLISSGSIIATYNSAEGSENVLKGLNIGDLSIIVSNSELTDKLIKIQQYWLRSENGNIPYYVNAISYKLLPSVTLVCIVEASENYLIRYFYLFSRQLDQLRTSNDLGRDLREIRKTMNDIHILLSKKKPIAENCFGFLKSPMRTATFLKSIWQQIETETRQASQNENKFRSESRFSIESIRSAFSSVSLTSSIFTRASMSEKLISKKLEILLSYAKRQINSLIQELCSISIQHSNKISLLLFNQCITKVVSPKQQKNLQYLKIGNTDDEIGFETFLNPSNFYLEILAYKIQFEDLQQEISYISENVQEDLDEIMQIKRTDMFSCNIFGKSGTPITIQYFYTPTRPATKTMKEQSAIRMTAAFPGYMNKNLAMKQTSTFLNIILNRYFPN